MGHRKWMLFGAGAESMEGAMREHNALYDAWVEATNWRTECLDENNRLDRELDEARQAQDNLIFQRNDFRHWHMNEQKKVADLTAELDAARKRIAELEDRPEANVRWSCSQMDFARHLFGMDAQSGVGANCNYERAGRAMDYLAKHALVPSTRVPFSDAQIERMADAAHTRRMRDEERTTHWKDLPLFAKDAWRQGIRAALAAGGLEPADVALTPTGHVLRDRLVEAEAKIERQRKNLNQLYEARERDARLIADLRAVLED